MSTNPKKLAKQPEHPLDDLIRTDRIPHIWCPGCGIGTVFSSCLSAIKATEIPYNKFTMVSGIGCSSRASGYMDFDTLHTAHGRAIPFATGIKLANPELTVIVITGDGDCTAIGGNHFIHGARRNIDLTVVLFNNSIYGMTGGQASPLTPTAKKATTAPYGTVDRPFDPCQLAQAAGATFVARGTAFHAAQLPDLIAKGVQNKGFSFIEAVTPCPISYGRQNKMGDAPAMLKWLGEHGLQIPLIIMTGYADIQSAVQAMKLGACDYIAKPVNPDELLKKIGEALNASSSALKQMMHSSRTDDAFTPNRPSVSPKQTMHSDKMKNQPLKGAEGSLSSSDFLEGESDAAKQLYNYVKLVSPTNMSVLINGASGTGKEYVAHRIHQLSKRADQPFVAIDCGSIPKELAASEFFGHIKGAFTGALTDKTGAFVEANGGTIFLDEIGNLSYEVQIQLLRALQERKIRPVGSNKEISVDVRLVSATNENLEQAIEKGAFREDLYHRINEFTLRMPQLKDRREDILLFANFFLDQANREMDKQLTGFDDKASRALLEYPWPGNLRQMKNMVRRATLLAQGKFITINELNELKGPAPGIIGIPLRNEEAEKHQIIEALRQTGNNKSRAAQLLGIDRKTLYNKLKLYNISD